MDNVITLSSKVRERVSFARFARLAKEHGGTIRAEIELPTLGQKGFGSVVIEYDRNVYEMQPSPGQQLRRAK